MGISFFVEISENAFVKGNPNFVRLILIYFNAVIIEYVIPISINKTNPETIIYAGIVCLNINTKIKLTTTFTIAKQNEETLTLKVPLTL